MTVYAAHGKQVLDPRGQHFADAADPPAATLIAKAMNAMHHLPKVEAAHVHVRRKTDYGDICIECGAAMPPLPDLPRCHVCLDAGALGGCCHCGRSSR